MPESFAYYKDLCTSTMILAFTDFVMSFKFYMDASGIRLQAVLYQE